MITVPLCEVGSPKYRLIMIDFGNDRINIDCQEYMNWIVANGVRGHIYNDLEARFENEIDAVAFKLKFGL